MIDRLAPILLLAGCVLFAGIVVAEIFKAPATETDAATAGARLRVEAPLPAPRAGADLRLDSTVAEILARPLFSSTRRPPPRNDGPAADTGLGDTRLTGIVTEPGRRFAIFAAIGAKPLVVSEGDTVGGWRVENITPREVSLSGPGGTKTLQPKLDPTLVPPAPPPGVAPPAPPIRPQAAASAVRPGFPSFPNRAPLRPGVLRERR